MFNHIKFDSLGKRTALADGDNITFADVREGRRDVDRHVSVLLSETSVLREVLEEISAND